MLSLSFLRVKATSPCHLCPLTSHMACHSLLSSPFPEIVEVYTVGIPPVRINLDKAAHFNKKVLNEQSDEDEWD